MINFIDAIQELNQSRANTEVEIISKSLFRKVNDDEDDAMVKAFPKVFPYGLGGPNDERNNGKKEDFEKYIQHISMISNPSFHESLVCLFLYSASIKRIMLKHACYRSRDDINLTSEVSNVKIDEIRARIEEKEGGHGVSPRLRTAAHLMNVVDTVTKYIPHSDKSAAQARGNAEALIVKFGDMTHFLTVTFDEENGIEMQAFSGIDVDIEKNKIFRDMTEKELRQQANLRQFISNKYPGYAAFYFSEVLDIVNKVIVGYDFVNMKPFNSGGFFGIPLAAMNTVEEQGRNRLHVHIGIWIENMQNTLNELFSGKTSQERDSRTKAKIRKEAQQRIEEEMARISSTATVPGNMSQSHQKFVGRHECINGSKQNYKLVTVENQKYRDMRHKEGSHLEQGNIAKCPKCKQLFNSNKLALRSAYYDFRNEVIKHGIDFETSYGKLWEGNDDDIEYRPSAFTKDKINSILCGNRITSLRTNGKGRINVQSLVNYARNLHAVCHTSSCFKHNDECRYLFPFEESSKDHVQKWNDSGDDDDRIPFDILFETNPSDDDKKEGSNEMFWWRWNGTKMKRPCYRLCYKRKLIDAFGNTYCRPVSMSDLMCNSNMQVLLPGPHVLYTTKYLTKGNNFEETMDFKTTFERMAKRLEEKRKENAYKEGLNRIITALFIHNSANVIGSSLGKYLVMKNSRFHFSHNFSFVPIHDIERLLNGLGTKVSAKTQHWRNNEKKTYFENYAYHYLLRPRNLEYLDPIIFFETYEVKTLSESVRKGKESMYEFLPNHPNYTVKCLVERKIPVVAKFRTYDFLDAEDLGGSITSKNFNGDLDAAEEQAKLIMLHFMHYRKLEDMQIDDSYLKCFKKKWKERKKCNDFNKRTEQYLQNIQNIRNNTHVPRPSDELKERTTMFKSSQAMDCSDSDEEEDISHDDSITQDILTRMFEGNIDLQQRNTNKTFPRVIDLESMKLLKDQGVSYQMKAPLKSEDQFIVLHDCGNEEMVNNDDNVNSNDDIENETAATRKCLIQLLCKQRIRKIPTNADSIIEDTTLCIEADGSAKSIIKWSRMKRTKEIVKEGTEQKERVTIEMDDDQKRAFQVIVAKFVLTYYLDAESMADDCRDMTMLKKYDNNVSSLKILAGGIDYLIMFLRDPGGSGKSEVIKQVLLYSQKFCKNLNVKFNAQTIKITALTGAAAVQINGETLDSNAGMMAKNRRDSCNRFLLI